jgi:hypothetical protein
VQVKKVFRKQLGEALLSSVREEMIAPRKTKSVRIAEEKIKDRAYLAVHAFLKELRALINDKFQQEDAVYNRNTKEDGVVRRVYEKNGKAIYEVAVPKYSDSWFAGFNISDWTDEVLEPSGNGRIVAISSNVPLSPKFD